MKKLCSLVVCASVLLVACVDQKAGANSPAKDFKIACTSVATCNVLEKLEVPASQVVAIPKSLSYKVPKEYENAKELGTAMAPDMELLKASKANLILSPNSLEDDLAKKYENIKVDSMFLNLKSTAGLYKSVQELGDILGKKAQADKLVGEFISFMKAFHEKNQLKKSPTVLVLMGLPGSYVVATDESYVGSLVKLAGGENVYGDGKGKDFLNINPEEMVKKKPDIIVRTSHAMPEQVMEMFAKEFKENNIWQHFDAVKQNKVYDLSYNEFGMSATFEYEKALNYLEKLFYGDGK